MASQKVLVTGASGYIGGHLVKHLAANPRFAGGITVATRSESLSLTREKFGAPGGSSSSSSSSSSTPGVSVSSYETVLAPESIRNFDVIINLAGSNIFGRRFSKPGVKWEVYRSRVDTTRRVVDAVFAAQENSKLRCFVQASGVGFYGNSAQEPKQSSTSATGSGSGAQSQPLTSSVPAFVETDPLCPAAQGVPGESDLNEDVFKQLDFETLMAATSRCWEAQARRVLELNWNPDGRSVHCHTLRGAVVLGKGSTPLALMTLPWKLGLGMRIGSGRQQFPYVHVHDFCRAVEFMLEQNTQSTRDHVWNIAAPVPTTNDGFSTAFARSLGCGRRNLLLSPYVPLGVPGSLMTLLQGQVMESLLWAGKVYPKNLIDAGFEFKYPDIDAVLQETCTPRAPGYGEAFGDLMDVYRVYFARSGKKAVRAG